MEVSLETSNIMLWQYLWNVQESGKNMHITNNKII